MPLEEIKNTSYSKYFLKTLLSNFYVKMISVDTIINGNPKNAQRFEKASTLSLAYLYTILLFCWLNISQKKVVVVWKELLQEGEIKTTRNQFFKWLTDSKVSVDWVFDKWKKLDPFDDSISEDTKVKKRGENTWEYRWYSRLSNMLKEERDKENIYRLFNALVLPRFLDWMPEENDRICILFLLALQMINNDLNLIDEIIKKFVKNFKEEKEPMLYIWNEINLDVISFSAHSKALQDFIYNREKAHLALFFSELGDITWRIWYELKRKFIETIFFYFEPEIRNTFLAGNKIRKVVT